MNRRAQFARNSNIPDNSGQGHSSSRRSSNESSKHLNYTNNLYDPSFFIVSLQDNVVDGKSPQEHEDSLLLSLPDDVLYLILSYLQPKDLCYLSSVCWRFQYLASKDTVWIQHAKKIAVIKPFTHCRSCSAKELCRAALNWQLGRFKEGFLVNHEHSKLMPWVQKYEDCLWYSLANSILCFEPDPLVFFHENYGKSLHCQDKDVTRFLIKKDTVVSGCRDGSIYCWDISRKPLFHYKQAHKSDTLCVDFTDSVVVSGSRDTTCKIFPMETNSCNDDIVLQTFDAGERVLCLQIDPCESLFAAGLAGCLDKPPIVVWDLESGEYVAQLSVNHRRGAGVLDLRFESPHELLTCGYDTFIRLWDMRTHTCVSQWEEPHDSALYCIESDGNNSMVVGTAHHGMVRLWDKRQTEPVQVYYSKNINSPVYSLAIDYGYLYLALDVGLNVMNFSSREMSIKPFFDHIPGRRRHRKHSYLHNNS